MALSSDCLDLKYFSSSGCRLISFHNVAEEQSTKEHTVLFRYKIWQFEDNGFLEEPSIGLKLLSSSNTPCCFAVIVCSTSFVFCSTQVFCTISESEIHILTLSAAWSKPPVISWSISRAGWPLSFLAKFAPPCVLLKFGDDEERISFCAVSREVRASSHTLSSIVLRFSLSPSLSWLSLAGSSIPSFVSANFELNSLPCRLGNRVKTRALRL